MLMEKDCSSESRIPRCLARQRSFRDIQSAISKIHPQLVKSVIGSGSSANYHFHSEMAFSAVPPSPPPPPDEEGEKKILFPSATSSSFSPPLPRPAEESSAPLTIFYNGSVAVFHVPRDKAETILKLAEKGKVPEEVDHADPKVTAAAAVTHQSQLLLTLNGDMPIARRKSLQTFLEKRKERLTLVSPHGCTHN